MKTKEERIHTIGFSLVSKLNIQIWMRLVGTFIILNLLFLTTSFLGLVIIGERSAYEVIQHLEMGVSESWPNELNMGNTRVLTGQDPSGGIAIPSPFKAFFPAETRFAYRRFKIPRLAEDVSLYQLFDTSQYELDIIVNETPYTLIVSFQNTIWLLKHLFIVLLLAQLLIAFKTLITRAELIRKVLKPIADLADQARTLSREKGPLSLGEMEALAGTLDEINATRLDTRIDLTATQDELKSLAVAINSLLGRINESYRLQARFVSDASHELRTPIAAIQGYANLLDRWGKNDPEVLQESIDAIKEEAADMKDLVEQLLFLARGDNNTMHLQIELVDLGALAETIFAETEMINAGHSFNLETVSAYILADRGLIKQATRILIDNAIKYTPTGGKISLSVSTTKNLVYFSVQDSGIGIPPQDIPHIFDRFYRADESRARATGGTGLGLSIAKWIAEHHGGHLEVLSRENFGSRISLVLPLNLESQK